MPSRTRSTQRTSRASSSGSRGDQHPDVHRPDQGLEGEDRVDAGAQLAPGPGPLEQRRPAAKPLDPVAAAGGLVFGQVAAQRDPHHQLPERGLQEGADAPDQGEEVAVEGAGVGGRDLGLGRAQHGVEGQVGPAAPAPVDGGRMDPGAQRDARDREVVQTVGEEGGEGGVDHRGAHPRAPSAGAPHRLADCLGVHHRGSYRYSACVTHVLSLFRLALVAMRSVY